MRPCLGKKKSDSLEVTVNSVPQPQLQEGRREAQKATRADFVIDPEVC